MICIHLTCGNVTFDLASADEHKAACERKRKPPVSPHLWAFECDHCGAQPGSPCMMPYGKSMASAVHVARHRLYERFERRAMVSA